MAILTYLRDEALTASSRLTLLVTISVHSDDHADERDNNWVEDMQAASPCHPCTFSGLGGHRSDVRGLFE